ncbi:MAG TPA: hypothetical protein VF190_09330, partial [Rhodothermales bacterium]
MNYFSRFLPHFAPDDGAATGAETAAQESVPGLTDANMDFDAAMEALDRAEGRTFLSDPEDAPDAAETAAEEAPAEQPIAAEAAGETQEDVAETPPAPALDFSRFEAEMPGAVIDSEDALLEHVRAYRESHEVLARYEELAQKSPALQTYVEALSKGMDERVAAITAFGDLAKVPDPDEDPEAYAEWKAEQKAARVRAEYEASERTREQQRVERVANEAQQAFTAAVKRLQLGEADQRALQSLFVAAMQG